MVCPPVPTAILPLLLLLLLLLLMVVVVVALLVLVLVPDTTAMIANGGLMRVLRALC